MLIPLILFSGLAVFKVQGAPQLVNLAWVHPTSVMNMQIRPPLPNNVFHPGPYKPIPYEPFRNEPLMSEAVANQEENYSGIEEDFGEFRQTTECNPRNWLQKVSCLNSDTVKTCTLQGTFRYTKCPQDWSCIDGLGLCVRPPRLSRKFDCPKKDNVVIPGIYPDPYSCRIYHVCDGANSATSITCFWPQVYDPLSQSCQMEGPKTPCYTFNCFGMETSPYAGDANIFAICSRNTVEKLSKCEVGYGWNENTAMCETPYCLKEGNIPVKNNNKQYYTCSRIFKRMVRSEARNCIGETTFNSTVGLCVTP